MPNIGEHNEERQGGNNTETPQRVREEVEMREKWLWTYFMVEKDRKGICFEQNNNVLKKQFKESKLKQI